ncbi:MAG: hypothetical protein KF914_01385 [Rhizobiaceae bacterium]|nr:hypothetical protein [Rhizobiaceae bacterium]
MALAGPASDAVRFFYAPDANETDPANRDRFTEPALAKLAEYDASTKNGEELGCIDWVLAVDAQDLDESELARSLQLEEKVSGDVGTVTARFRLFADEASRREIVWDVRKVDGAWKVADIASPVSDWRLSQIDCGMSANPE